MFKKFLSHSENILVLLIFFFSILINQYYGNRGAFPIDSFAHFDIAFRILQGDIPFQDYWLVSGLFIDYMQAFFFYLFGVNFQVYVLQASLTNCLISILTFYLLKNFNLNVYLCFFYSISFAILAYTTSGTLSVDHHASLLCLLAIYSLILAIKTEKKKFLYFLPIILGLAFLTKSAPTVYIIFSIFFILLFYIFNNQKYLWLRYIFLGSIFFLILVFLFGYYQGIQMLPFLQQYILFPSTIAEGRYGELNFTKGIFFTYKFIYLVFLPIFFINIFNFFKLKNYYKENYFYYFISLLMLMITLIFHQINTANQEFIFFLIPVLCAFSHIYLNLHKVKLNKYLNVGLILICLFITFKYHIRFNEERKFHEMNNVDFKLTVDAKKIDKKLSGLNWITPIFEKNPMDEINLIKEALVILKNDQRKKMVLTNYSFFSSILEENLNSPSRWYISNGSAYPLENNKYFNIYKNFLVNVIKKNNIEVVYIINPINKKEIYRYIDESCFDESKITLILKELNLNKRNDIY